MFPRRIFHSFPVSANSRPGRRFLWTKPGLSAENETRHGHHEGKKS